MKEKIFLSRFYREKSLYILSIITAIIILFLFIDYTLLSAQPTYAQSFGNLTNLSNNTGFSSNPQITTFGSNVYVVWRDNSSGNDDIYFKRSSDTGNSFNTTKNLSNTNGSSTDSQITATGNNAYIVWSDTTTGNGDIYFKSITDNGTTLSFPENLSNNDGRSDEPRIAAVGSNIYVVWRDNSSGNDDIYFSSSADNGTTFSSPKNLSTNLDGPALFPQVEAIGNSVYVAWQDETPDKGRIRFRASNDNGNDFSITRVLSQENEVNANSPQLSISESAIYVVWEDNSRSENNSSKNFDLLFRVSVDGGSNFTNTMILTKNPGGSFDPNTVTSGENMYAVWEDNTAGDDTSLNWEVRFRGVLSNGENTTDTKILSENIGEVADFPQIAASESNLYVVWSDLFIRTYPGMFEIFFTFSKDEGRNFSQAVNLSSNQGSSVAPRIAASEDYAFIVWSDTTTGNGDIYFRSVSE
ncbi:MAG TPA: sialidase family protein [Nitrososphaeraceae archaeon]|nr:sialidase family protein [Nitrososphaeraceae archaeon]